MTVAALSAVAAENDWVVDTSEPDFFGDVRVDVVGIASHGVLVFDPRGKLAGAYFWDRQGGTMHTESITRAKQWLKEFNGEVLD
jgi:hypothetical protein